MAASSLGRASSSRVQARTALAPRARDSWEAIDLTAQCRGAGNGRQLTSGFCIEPDSNPGADAADDMVGLTPVSVQISWPVFAGLHQNAGDAQLLGTNDVGPMSSPTITAAPASTPRSARAAP